MLGFGPLEEVRLARWESNQNVSLVMLKINRIFNGLQRCHRAIQLKFPVDFELAIRESPNLQLILLAHRHDALLALELVYVIYLLLVNTEARINKVDVSDFYEDD